MAEEQPVVQNGPVQPTPRPPAPAAARPAPAVQPRRPGEIVLAPRGQRGLGRLYKLEQEIAAIPGVGDAMVHVLDDGHVLITVPPHAEGRVREFLALTGELGAGAGG
jgi:hypothetical protein